MGGGRGSAQLRKETEAEVQGDSVVLVGSKKEARRFLQEHHAADGHHHQAVLEDRTGHEVTLRSHLRHSHRAHGAQRREKHEGADESVQRGRASSGQRSHTGSSANLGMGRTDRGSTEAGAAVGAANAATLTEY